MSVRDEQAKVMERRAMRQVLADLAAAIGMIAARGR